MATWDRPTANAAAARLAGLAPSALAVGHGRVVPDPGRAIERALAAAGVARAEAA
jgi:acetyl esterase/lipase